MFRTKAKPCEEPTNDWWVRANELAREAAAEQGFAAGSIWSLWDLMRAFDAGGLMTSMWALRGLAAQIKDKPNPQSVPLENHNQLAAHATVLVEECERLALTASMVAARRLKKVILEDFTDGGRGPAAVGSQPLKTISGMGLARFGQTTQELMGRLRDELEARSILAIDPRFETYLTQPEPLFGSQVFTAFPSANLDIEEAGKCLALGRGTACVMHTMRAGEVGLRVLARDLNAGGDDWGGYIREIGKALEQRLKAAGKRTPEEERYARMSSDFDTLRRAFRNATMHPDRSYSVEQAEEIFASVRSLMRHLSDDLTE